MCMIIDYAEGGSKMDYEKESREAYIARLRSYENTPVGYEDAKILLKDWISFVELNFEKAMELHGLAGVQYDDIIKEQKDLTISNEIRKVMLISLYGFDEFMEVAKNLKEFEPETVIDVIEDILTKG